MSDTPPSLKRKRPTKSTACDACQRRKSRCELIEPSGCLRCRTLGTECSVAAPDAEDGDADFRAGHEASRSPWAGPSERSELLSLVREMAGRMARMEGEMNEIRMGMRSKQGSAGADVRSARQMEGCQVHNEDHVEGYPGVMGSLAMSPEQIIPRALDIAPQNCSRDPIIAGMMSREDLVQAFERVKEHMHRISEMPLPSSSTNPFLRLAIFAFAVLLSPSPAPSSLTPLKVALHHLQHRPAPDVDAVIGLYLLSFLPLHQSGAAVDAYDGAARAFRMAKQLGLDTAAKHRWDAGPDTRYLADVYNCVWSRYRATAILSSATLSDGLSSEIATALVPAQLPPRLSLECLMLDEIQAVSAALLKVRVAEQHDALLVMQLESAVGAFVHNSSWYEHALKGTAPFPLCNQKPKSPQVPSNFIRVKTYKLDENTAYLILTRYLYTILVCLKISTDAPDLLPSPLNYDDRFGLIKNTAPQIVRVAMQAIKFVVAHPELDIRTLPAHHVILLLLAYKAVLQSSLADASSTHGAESALAISPFRDRLVHSGAQIRAMVDAIDRHDAPDGAWREAMQHNSLLDGLMGDFGPDGAQFWPDFVGPGLYDLEF